MQPDTPHLSQVATDTSPHRQQVVSSALSRAKTAPSSSNLLLLSPSSFRKPRNTQVQVETPPREPGGPSPPEQPSKPPAQSTHKRRFGCDRTAHEHPTGVSGLVVKSIVAIDGPRVRFAADAFFAAALLSVFILVLCFWGKSAPSWTVTWGRWYGAWRWRGQGLLDTACHGLLGVAARCTVEKHGRKSAAGVVSTRPFLHQASRHFMLSYVVRHQRNSRGNRGHGAGGGGACPVKTAENTTLKTIDFMPHLGIWRDTIYVYPTTQDLC
ncbi:hypothetical protein VTI74DRAFT_3216 [Chaetomium olivicolor]